MAHGNHLKHMLYGGLAVFALLFLAGMSVQTALSYGILLACPLMMVWMMLSMNGHGHGHSGPHDEPTRDRDARARHD